MAENRVGRDRMGCDRTADRVCRPESPGYREEAGGVGGRGTWLIDVTEPDEAKEGAVTKVDFAMAPLRIASLDYQNGNELTTEAGSPVDTTQPITRDKYCAMTLTFSFHPLPFSISSLPPSALPTALSYHSAQSRRQWAVKMNFCSTTDFCAAQTVSPAISATRISRHLQDCRSSFLMVYLRNEEFASYCVRLSLWKGTVASNWPWDLQIVLYSSNFVPRTVNQWIILLKFF